jgi:phage head maturation protease
MSVVDNDTSQEVGASVPSAPPRENLYRAINDIGLERSADGGMPTLTGHVAVWDQWTEIRSAVEGNFMERFSPTSMVKTLTERTPKVLFDHGKDPTVGNKVLGPIRSVSPDAYGAAYAVSLLDTSYNRDLIPGLEAGLYGSSFRFRVLQEDYVSRPSRSEYNPRGLPERTVTEAQVMEFGPVTFPAYAGATAGVRSITDTMLEKQLLGGDEMLERLADMIAQRASVNTQPFTVSFSMPGTAREIGEPGPSGDTTRADTPGGSEMPDMPPGVSEMPDGVSSCSVDGKAGYTGGDVCHTHNGTADGMASAMAKARIDANRGTEPEPSEATTQESEAEPFTFRFAPNPSERKGK